MPALTAKRTLVKSPPELWSELSEADRLAKHLEAFGEIKITKLDPEHTVAWEGESASGTVSIEPSGWGTKVTLTAHVEEPPATAVDEPEPEPDPEPELDAQPEPEVEPEPELDAQPEPEVEAEPEPATKPGFFARLFGRAAKRQSAPVAPEPEPEPVALEPEPEPEPAAQHPVAAEPEPDPVPEPDPDPVPEPEPSSAQAVLEDALEALGSAHHRPFSRG
ncbi:MAG: hypothetical protein ABW142_05290 [Thermoleophilaceae bacterium]